MDAKVPRDAGEDDPGELPLAIEDYALIGDCLSGALVGRNGSIDWLCWPRFDSDACFAAILGTSHHGRWLLAPDGPVKSSTRSYRGDTMVLETIFETDQGRVAIVDFMPIGQETSSIVRRVIGLGGRVAMRMELVLRFNYGASTPWVTRLQGAYGIEAVCGPDSATLYTRAPLHGEDHLTASEFDVSKGERVDFILAWGASHLPPPPYFDPGKALAKTERFWQDWSGRCKYEGKYKEQVRRSLITLKALTYAPTGGIVAALTTSLPEQLGGSRNWDYRFCWLRDSTLTLIALMEGGYYEEAQAWRDWLHRSVAGDPAQLQIMYGIGGERRLTEWSPSWLPGYHGASPVRIGNAASEQLQLDIYGEMLGAVHLSRKGGLEEEGSTWSMQVNFIDHLLSIWDQPDDGIWEVRGGRRHFTHSKMMAWVAIDRSIRDAETYGFEAPLDLWKAARETMHAEICEKGYDSTCNTFTQSFGNPELDASLLLMPIVGFLPIDDRRVAGTIKAIEKELLVDGFVLRYRTEECADGLPPGEGTFLPCSFWLAGAYKMQGRDAEADAIFDRLVSIANDVGLLSEEYDPRVKRQVGNFPQAFSHLALIFSALSLYGESDVQMKQN